MMEWSSRAGLLSLNEKVPTAFEICGQSFWKLGSSGSGSKWSLGGRLKGRRISSPPGSMNLEVDLRSLRSKSSFVKPPALKSGAPIIVNSSSDAVADNGRFNFGKSRTDQGSSLSLSLLMRRRSQSSTAVEAGRSKGKKKGQTSGGRIEQRPSSFRRTPSRSPSPPLPRPKDGADAAAKEPAGEGGLGGGGGGVVSEAGNRRAKEEELNLTWQEVGLRDRRSGGRFKPEKGAEARAREATRVGGWGRDKSMQRVLTPEQQSRRSSGSGSRKDSKAPSSSTSEASPALVKKQKKLQQQQPLYEEFDNDPRVIHPPDYYKYGPYGPYAWKGIPIGKPKEGDLATSQVVFFSNVESEAEAEDREKANVAVEYTHRVAKFDANLGIRYFYVFARRRHGPRPDPWQDWTLVAQIAVESGDEFGEQGDLFRKLGSRIQSITSQCVAWARPDLTYVKRPKFQLRLEPQENFFMELWKLLDPNLEGSNGWNSYYATLCRLVDVDLDASASRVRSGYEALDEAGRFECLKHVFSAHPVKILSSARYERQVRGQTVENGSASDVSNDKEDFYDNDGGDELTDDEVKSSTQSGALIRNAEGSGGAKSSADEQESSKRQLQKPVPSKGGRLWKVPESPPVFRSAVRPFSYSNMIEEIAQLRSYASQKQAKISSG